MLEGDALGGIADARLAQPFVHLRGGVALAGLKAVLRQELGVLAGDQGFALGGQGGGTSGVTSRHDLEGYCQKQREGAG